MPQYYLRGFRDNKKALWVYEKGAAAPRESNPKAEASHEDYYAFTDLGGRDTSAEETLSKVESIVAPTFRSLRQRYYKMSAEDVGRLFAFMGVMFVRVPAYRDYWNKKRRARESNSMRRSWSLSPESSKRFLSPTKPRTARHSADPEALRQAVLSGQFVITQKSAAVNLLFTLLDGREIGEYFVNEFSYDLYYAPAGSYFVASDNPIVMIRTVAA